ncbi:MAG: hypothetical protein AAF985_25490 [Bacteroidota bacterium]
MSAVKNIRRSPERKRWYVLFSALFFFSYAHAQLSVDNPNLFPLPQIAQSAFPSFSKYVPLVAWLPTTKLAQNPTPQVMNNSAPKVYSYHHLGIMCKLDVQLEKSMKHPVKFRLGTQEYVDRLEGKY